MRHRPLSVSCLDRSIVRDDMPVEVIPGLFVGSMHSAFNEKELQKAGVTHIVNAAGLPATFQNLFSYMTIDLRDKEYASVLSCLPLSNAFIDASLKQHRDHKVLVHCSFGRSRSAALVIGYLMLRKDFSFKEAHDLLREKRPVVSLNESFHEQLQLCENLRSLSRAQQAFLSSKRRIEALKKSRNGHQSISISFGDNCVVPCVAPLNFPLVCSHCHEELFQLGDVALFHDSSSLSAAAGSDSRVEQECGHVKGILKTSFRRASSGVTPPLTPSHKRRFVKEFAHKWEGDQQLKRSQSLRAAKPKDLQASSLMSPNDLLENRLLVLDKLYSTLRRSTMREAYSVMIKSDATLLKRFLSQQESAFQVFVIPSWFSKHLEVESRAFTGRKQIWCPFCRQNKIGSVKKDNTEAETLLEISKNSILIRVPSI